MDEFDEFGGEERGVPVNDENTMVLVDTHLVFRAVDESGMDGTQAFTFLRTLERLMNDPEICGMLSSEDAPPEKDQH